MAQVPASGLFRKFVDLGAGTFCLSMEYLMDGADIQSLTVNVISFNPYSFTEVLFVPLDQGSSKQTLQTLVTFMSNGEIQVVAKSKAGLASDIAVYYLYLDMETRCTDQYQGSYIFSQRRSNELYILVEIPIFV